MGMQLGEHLGLLETKITATRGNTAPLWQTKYYKGRNDKWQEKQSCMLHMGQI